MFTRIFQYNNLEEWTPDATVIAAENIECEIGGMGPGTKAAGNGWDAAEMFKVNSSKFDIQTSYDRTLTGYTVELDKDNTTDLQVPKKIHLIRNINFDEKSSNRQIV